jgi:hypothetical protein
MQPSYTARRLNVPWRRPAIYRRAENAGRSVTAFSPAPPVRAGISIVCSVINRLRSACNATTSVFILVSVRGLGAIDHQNVNESLCGL